MMKRVLLATIFVSFFTVSSFSQVINFGKTLPVRAFSITAAPVFNVDNIYNVEQRGMAYWVMAGYGIGYDVDMSLKYAYFDGPDYFGADMQYLFRETRKSYYSLFGGIHKWEEYGVDMTFSFTHTPQYWINLTAGLDIDVDFTNSLELRAWIPLNVGINFDDRYYLFMEYDLPANERAWDIFGGGITFIFR